jgi:hypothetical protein
VPARCGRAHCAPRDRGRPDRRRIASARSAASAIGAVAGFELNEEHRESHVAPSRRREVFSKKAPVSGKGGNWLSPTAKAGHSLDARILGPSPARGQALPDGLSRAYDGPGLPHFAFRLLRLRDGGSYQLPNAWSVEIRRLRDPDVPNQFTLTTQQTVRIGQQGAKLKPRFTQLACAVVKTNASLGRSVKVKWSAMVYTS